MAYQKNAKMEALLKEVYEAEVRIGYPAIQMMSDYLCTRDPSYITASGNARKRIGAYDPDEIITELLRAYLGQEK